eukprot:TRINITY_DN6126_c0_g1_i1.p1 TRINITY_DN6126_c0_g1~~TRINITY_DN6126_c0_g1_i1.p1  ORF type:complete len:191 (-),score=16.06 TRINITY_DN6126_c0_g1_i1:169-741(-)
MSHSRESVAVGSIHLIFGPMFSGKSTELLRRIRRYTVANRKCLVIKYIKDTRISEDEIATDVRQLWTARPAARLFETQDLSESVEVIGIDEGQFFPDLVLFCEHMANQGKIVIVAALDGTFERKPFGETLQLIPLSETVTKLNAVCMVCSGDAAFSKRLGSEKEVEIIGGREKYISVCRECYHKESGEVI